MRGILIDPLKKTVECVNVEGNLSEIYDLLGVECITIVPLDFSDALYLDDEGLLVPKNEQAYWRMKGSSQPFAGRGLILGTDEEGDNDDAVSDLKDVKASVIWIDREAIDPEDYTGFAIYPI